MATPSFPISVDLSHLIPPNSALTADAFPHLAKAVRLIAEAAHTQWQGFAAGADLPGGRIEPRSGAYLASIKLRQLGDFSAEVYSELPYARLIEEGAPERDMKRVLNSSLKVRLAKDGRRYLIIPFRWDGPGSVKSGNRMTESVRDWWRDKRSSSITGTYERVSGTGAMDIRTRKAVTVPGWRYDWGDRLKKTDLAGLGVRGTMAKRMEGMVNFRRPGKSGGASQSQHLTFRVMMEGSKGWIAPAREGLWPARTTAEMLRPAAEQAFGEAIKRDVEMMLGVGR